ncbi:MAG: ABC transporter permease [Patescibacteria group bacterium]|jgi:ABC-2 type transport system permease protein
MKLHRILAVVRRHLYDMRRNLDRVNDSFFWPILDVLIWGLFTVYLSDRLEQGFTFVNFLLGAIILWGVFYSFQRDLAMGFLEELWSRNLINLFSTPLTIWEYISGLLLVNLLKTAFGFFVAATIAGLLYHFNVFSLSVYFLPFVLILFVFSLSIGFLITGFIFRYTTRVQTVAWSFAGVLQPLSCVMYPLSTLPMWLQRVAWFFPTTHVFEAMRQLLAGGGFSMEHFWWGLLLSVGYLTLSIVFFKIIFEITRARGLLAKLA